MTRKSGMQTCISITLANLVKTIWAARHIQKTILVTKIEQKLIIHWRNAMKHQMRNNLSPDSKVACKSDLSKKRKSGTKSRVEVSSSERNQEEKEPLPVNHSDSEEHANKCKGNILLVFTIILFISNSRPISKQWYFMWRGVFNQCWRKQIRWWGICISICWEQNK